MTRVDVQTACKNNNRAPTRWLPLALTLAVSAALPQAFADQAATSIHIQAQPLGQALSQLGQQTALQVFFSPELVAGKQAPAVDGNLAPEAALRSEERRVGQEGVSTCRSRWSPCPEKK